MYPGRRIREALIQLALIELRRVGREHLAAPLDDNGLGFIAAQHSSENPAGSKTERGGANPAAQLANAAHDPAAACSELAAKHHASGCTGLRANNGAEQSVAATLGPPTRHGMHFNRVQFTHDYFSLFNWIG